MTRPCASSRAEILKAQTWARIPQIQKERVKILESLNEWQPCQFTGTDPDGRARQLAGHIAKLWHNPPDPLPDYLTGPAPWSGAVLIANWPTHQNQTTEAEQANQ